MSNPFTLSFGKRPTQFISRLTQTNEIIDDWTAKEPSSQLYMLTGLRGSGKTVMLSTISSELKQKEEWIVLELNPTRDLLQSLAAKLYAIPDSKTLLKCIIEWKRLTLIQKLKVSLFKHPNKNASYKLSLQGLHEPLRDLFGTRDRSAHNDPCHT